MHKQDPESKDTQENFFGKKQEESIPSHKTSDIDNQGDDPNKNVEQNVVRDECSFQKKSKECTSDNIDMSMETLHSFLLYLLFPL